MKNEIRFTLESKQRPKLAQEIGNRDYLHRKMGKATVPFIPFWECCDQPFRWRWIMTFW